MHDQKKNKEKPDEAARRIEQEKITKFRALYGECFALRDVYRRHCNIKQQETEAASKSLSSENAWTAEQTKESLAKLETLLEINPDCYSLFAFRRQMLEYSWLNAPLPTLERKTKSETEAGEGDKKQEEEEESEEAFNQRVAATTKLVIAKTREETLVAEIKFNNRIVKKDYKSYFAWEHRRWIIRLVTEATRRKILQAEQLELEKLLSVDERNFHAWGYRRWVTKQLTELGMYSDAKELAFTNAKIGKNFSNYSAWHNRAMIFSAAFAVERKKNKQEAESSATREAEELAAVKKLKTEIAIETLPSPLSLTATLKSMLAEEFDAVTRAIFCDPKDQSSCFYAKFLVMEVSKNCAMLPDDWTEFGTKHLAELCESCEALIAEESGGGLEVENPAADATAADKSAIKWPLYLKWFMRTSPEMAPLCGGLLSAEEQQSVVAMLIEVDPMRKGVYSAFSARAPK